MLLFDLVNLGQFLLRVCVNELLDDHVAATDTDDQFPIEDLCIYFPRTKYVISVAQFLNGHGAVGLMDILPYHFI